MTIRTINVLLGAAVSTLLLAGTAIAQAEANPDGEAVKGECHGVNACKGQGDCGGKDHACAGKNACKGAGFKKMTEAECKDADGTFKKAEM